jgi:cell division protease FtsH
MWVAVVLVTLGVAYAAVLEYQRPHVEGDRLRFDRFVELVADGKIQSATVLDQDAYVVGTYLPPDGEASGEGSDALHDMPLMDPQFSAPPEDGSSGGDAQGEGGASAGQVARFNTPLVGQTQASTLELLVSSGVPTTVKQQVGKQIAQFASMLLPGVMLVVLFIYLILSYRNGTGLFGIKSGARQFAPEQGPAVSFADVAGQQAAVAELADVRDFLADPDRYGQLGAVAPTGVLLYGPPGCGKTLLAKALAGEAGARFFSISGSDFVELYAGVGAARVRDLFAEARQAAPALVFIDELDSIGRARSTGSAPTGQQGEQEQALNQILAELDGFSAAEGLIVLAATNRPDLLDQALLRPGRFDRSVGLERPDETGRLAILDVHARQRTLAGDVDLAAIAGQAVGLTGADLATVANEAALLAARAGKPAIGHHDLQAAVTRVIEAPERQRRLALSDRSIASQPTGDERVTLADVAGVDEAADEFAEITAYLADPDRFAAMGAHPPKGVLLAGPPGCGKTLLGRAVAGEANAAFLSVTASEFVEVYAGTGAARARDLFAEAAARAPAIVFLDEIDAIGGARSSSDGGDSSTERAQTLNQILVELDGFTPHSGVVAIAATNRPDILDTALTRPGRFDRHLTVSLPDLAARQAILERHAHGKPLASDVDLAAVAVATPGFSGAALAAVLNDAALLATRRNQDTIDAALVDEAIDRTASGVAATQWIMTQPQRHTAAYHQAGRGLATYLLTGKAPAKLTLAAGGSNQSDAGQIDPLTATRDTLLTHMAVDLAGRAGEELALGTPSAAAATALAAAERLAHQMICELGMSAKLAPLALPHPNGHPAYSEHTARLIDTEKHALVTEAYQHAWDTLTAHRAALERLATALLDHETITAHHLADLAAPPADQPTNDNPPPTPDSQPPPRQATPANDTTAPPAHRHPGRNA